MYSHERSLVQRYADRPFAFVGVNVDPDRDEARRAIEKNALNWRSWWDGADGSIARHWGVRSFPNIFVTDHHGIIRFHQVRGPDLEAAVEQLLRELERERQS
jgi:hypothetical protein